MRIGFDIGGVIVGHGYGHPDKVHDQQTEDTNLLGSGLDFLNVVPNKDAFETIAKLVELVGSHNCFIISKCGPPVERKTRTWLEWHDFFTQTRFDRQNVRFCRKRPDKAQIAATLALSHFIDDRPDVLEYMMDFVDHRYLYAPQIHQGPLDFDVPIGIVVVGSWQSFFNELT